MWGSPSSKSWVLLHQHLILLASSPLSLFQPKHSFHPCGIRDLTGTQFSQWNFSNSTTKSPQKLNWLQSFYHCSLFGLWQSTAHKNACILWGMSCHCSWLLCVLQLVRQLNLKLNHDGLLVALGRPKHALLEPGHSTRDSSMQEYETPSLHCIRDFGCHQHEVKSRMYSNVLDADVKSIQATTFTCLIMITFI